MYRYLALVWNTRDSQSDTAAQRLAGQIAHLSSDWSCAFDGEGLAIFHADLISGASETRVLHRAAGAILGRIFNQGCDGPSAALNVKLDDIESSNVIESEGLHLFSHYWGRYVAIVRNATTGQVWVLRDPLGALPCFLVRWQRVNIIFSDLEDCLAIAPMRMSVNWRYITSWVSRAGLMHTQETALEEVSEILPGERVSFFGSSIDRSNQWNPIDIARQNPIDHVEEAIEALRSKTRACVHTWAACYRGIVHNLSGGLDSSIVLSCLATAPTRPAVTCVHTFSGGPGEDERKYARMMASHVGIELVERQLDDREIQLEDILGIRPSVRPWHYLYELEHAQLDADMVARYGVENGTNGLFSGGGGDGVFYQFGAEFAVSDYLFQHGWSWNLFKVAMDAAHMSRKSIWSLLRNSIHARIFGTRYDFAERLAAVPNTLVNHQITETGGGDKERFVPPWLTKEVLRHAPPGAIWHAQMMNGVPLYYSSFSRKTYSEHTMPLLSQPLVELCMRIPSYLLISDGRDRSVARRAFAGELPQEIVRRHAKGNANQRARNIMDHNLEFVRELLLDGVLVRKGLLNRDGLESYLTPGRPLSDHQYVAILHNHLCTEAWLHRWAA